MANDPRAKGVQLSKLKRYKLILDLYKKHKTEDIPDTVILRKYICPVYPISRTTLYTILTTPVNKLLAELQDSENK
ncbi:hypothetical protein [Flavobacterium sandaracinum]|uniref:Uncharacterized protein n=1 Tax=Flavobacterium sandaracinum TaxID=2541733 RepID=A0A4R5CSW5_9FLAO|nr:hypothetical protein [Flavobacterium sandaracinum]TDE01514.1 hypothetical protein E0F91_14260 [Flavobacterium sandaracinum]